MIIKKYLAKTERDAIELAKAELGSNAIVMNIKKIHPHGLSKVFIRAKVEVTAALDENVVYEEKNDKRTKDTDRNSAHFDRAASFHPDIIVEQEDDPKDDIAIEERLNNLQKLLEKQMVKTEEVTNPTKASGDKKEKEDASNQTMDRTTACKELIFNQLIENDVDQDIAKKLMDDIDRSLPKDAALDHVLASIYQKIILMLGQPLPIESMSEKTKYIFFIGSTGVGKTTTIAKIASRLKIDKKMKIALVTADTYRIAAVDQLKTYANILGVPLKVVYSPDEMGEAISDLDQYDVCLVDTAGRSHRNREQIEDIRALIEKVPEDERHIYLVLNAGTKYSDLKEISQVYSKITDYSIIFTKLDETSCNGILLNMRMLTERSLSYVTWGQNVPDDIGEVDAQKIAKKLLGGRS